VTLELRNITKRVGAETYIHGADLTLAERGFNVLLGTTLAGKTTLMQIMAGLEKPTSGEVWFKGRNITRVPVQKRNVAMVHQTFINYPNLSVFENIASPLRVARLARPEIAERVGRVGDLLQLGPLMKRRPGELSGGQQQRTALARALVKDADLVLLDEPLANLDFKLREELRDELPKLFADRNCTVVYATSEPGEALLLGGHTATLFEGRVTAFGETPTIYRRPHNLLTAEVFSDPPINLAQVEKRGGDIHFADDVSWPGTGVVRDIADGPYTLAIRPHHVSPNGDGPARVALEGRVLVAELSGSESVIHFAQGERTWISQSHGVHRLAIGNKARFFLDPSRCMFFDGRGKLAAAPEPDRERRPQSVGAGS